MPTPLSSSFASRTPSGLYRLTVGLQTDERTLSRTVWFSVPSKVQKSVLFKPSLEEFLAILEVHANLEGQAAGLAARRMTQQFRSGTVEKVYWALVEGSISPHSATCVDWLRKDERHRRMHIAPPTLPDAKEARLTYRRLRHVQHDSLLEVKLQTGRKHQIRLQLAHRGYPILGDRKYGSRRPWPRGIALHARRLSIRHPVGDMALQFEAPLPAAWRSFDLAE